MRKFLAVVIFILGIVIIALFMKSGRTYTEEKEIVTVKISETFDEVSDNIKNVKENSDSSVVKEIIDFTKEKSKNGELNSIEEVRNAILEAEEKFGATISDETRDEIANTVVKLENMGFSSDIIVEKAEGLYEKYGADFVDHLEEAFTEAAKEAAENTAKNVWGSFKDTVKETVNKITED